jgi:type III secretion protein Y
VSLADRDTVRYLHALGHLYGRHGQPKRGVVLLLIAARLAPDDTGVLRTLAHLLLLDGASERALAVLERIRGESAGDHPALALMRAKALMAAGREIEARRSFRDYVERREAA